jgi:hypothetical protein
MEKSIEIVKSLLIPKLEKDISFHSLTFKDAFWETFTLSFLNYENDAKPTYELIYSLQLDNAERIFDKLTTIYSKLIKELAENYVLGNNDRATDFLIQNDNSTFQKEVRFLETMQQAIKSVERKRIKADLPTLNERLTFELSDTEIAAVAKKIEREDLRANFKKWDEELKVKSEPTIYYSLDTETKTVQKSKVISLSWIKYAVAACVVVTAGVLYFKFSNNNVDSFIEQDENTVVTIDEKKDSDAKPTTEKPIKTYVTSTSEVSVQYPSSLGFTNTGTAKPITIYFKDASLTIDRLKKEYTISDKVAGSGPRAKTIEKQLKLLEAKSGKYEFDGKQLIIYSEKNKELLSVLTIDEKTFYLKRGNQYSPLYFTKIPLSFQSVKEPALIEQLEKISFENE